MANVSVLLHLGDRKKIVAVPSNCADHYAFLCQTVVEWTGECVQYFERFDSDWDEWVEVEKNNFQASHKDRIKVVISIPDESSEVTNHIVGKQEENRKVLAECSYVRIVCQFSYACRSHKVHSRGSRNRSCWSCKSAQFTVCTVYQNGQLCGEKQVVEAELKSIVNDSVVHARVTSNEKGVYEVIYTEIRWRHILIVKVNSAQIAGSPFQVFAKIHPTQLQQYVSSS